MESINTLFSQLQEQIANVDTFLENYQSIATNLIPTLDLQLSRYIETAVAKLPTDIINTIKERVDWSKYSNDLMADVKNSRPVQKVRLNWTNLPTPLAFEIEPLDTDSILNMQIYYTEEDVKAFNRHRKIAINELNEYKTIFEQVLQDIEDYKNKFVNVFIEQNMITLYEYHYKHVLELIKTEKSKKSKRASQLATPVAERITLNNVNVKMERSQKAFFENAINEIVKGVVNEE